MGGGLGGGLGAGGVGGGLGGGARAGAERGAAARAAAATAAGVGGGGEGGGLGGGGEGGGGDGGGGVGGGGDGGGGDGASNWPVVWLVCVEALPAPITWAVCVLSASPWSLTRLEKASSEMAPAPASIFTWKVPVAVYVWVVVAVELPARAPFHARARAEHDVPEVDEGDLDPIDGVAGQSLRLHAVGRHDRKGRRVHLHDLRRGAGRVGWPRGRGGRRRGHGGGGSAGGDSKLIPTPGLDPVRTTLR